MTAMKRILHGDSDKQEALAQFNRFLHMRAVEGWRMVSG